jgi:predicted GNAT family acetyltransferase
MLNTEVDLIFIKNQLHFKFIMKSENLDINKNELLRQFEYKSDGIVLKIEYSEQGKKIFLTRFEGDESEQFKNHFFKSVLDKLSDEGVSVVPTCPVVASFFKKNRATYKHLLPIGINL